MTRLRRFCFYLSSLPSPPSMPRTQITRFSSCGQLGLPPHLACLYCQASITQANLRGIKPPKIKKCQQLWHHRWATHRTIEKVLAYKKVKEYLGYTNIEDVEVNECYFYGKTINYKQNEDTKEQEEKKEMEETRQIESPNSISLLTEETDQDGSNPYCNTNTEEGVSDKGMYEEKETDDKRNTLPSSHVLIHKTQLTILKHKAALYDQLMKQISAKKYYRTDVGNNMIGFGASILPKAGYEGIAKSLPFFIGSFLSNCGNHIILIS